VFPFCPIGRRNITLPRQRAEKSINGFVFWKRFCTCYLLSKARVRDNKLGFGKGPEIKIEKARKFICLRYGSDDCLVIDIGGEGSDDLANEEKVAEPKVVGWFWLRNMSVCEAACEIAEKALLPAKGVRSAACETYQVVIESSLFH
jgi:hypothetical protein